ncbi:hypothetical protein [uncultured Parabacteroides sp.]|uniref:hypothetical protein n=1 Tax=uncultured Parabacteroides sp. TaxID=512312 RepID=UPI00258A2536|nr:hypothetical protein [uncultured Parabacteroides sp.]
MQGIGEVHHVRPANRKLAQSVQFRIGGPLPWLVAECPRTNEVATCHAALVGGTLDLGKLLFSDLGDHNLVTPYNGLLLHGLSLGSIFIMCHN